MEDRVGFACLYFNDAMFIESLNAALTESSLRSSLQGLFICGLSRDLSSFRLLRRFLLQSALNLVFGFLPFTRRLHSF